MTAGVLDRPVTVSVSGLRHRLPGGRTLFDDLELTVRAGESLVLLGPSGVGKSTLLRLLAGLEEPDDGQLSVGSRDGAVGRRHSHAVVFQKPLLYPWLSVRENVALGGKFRALRGRVDTTHVDELLAHFGIADLADARPDQISGGQAQRACMHAAQLAEGNAVHGHGPPVPFSQAFNFDHGSPARKENTLIETTDIARCCTLRRLSSYRSPPKRCQM